MQIPPDSMLHYLVVLLIVGNVFAFGIGVLMLAAPQQLSDVFKFSNRWISTRKLTKPLDTPHYHLDKLVLARPRLWGGLITVLGLFSAVVLWWFVLGV